jgi:hypothetical protein
MQQVRKTHGAFVSNGVPPTDQVVIHAISAEPTIGTNHF